MSDCSFGGVRISPGSIVPSISPAIAPWVAKCSTRRVERDQSGDLMLRRWTHERLRAPSLERAVMRYELSDNEWRIIREMLPSKPRGVPRVDDRRVLNGIFWVLRSGAPRGRW